MEDTQIKDLFCHFEPELTPDSEFLSRLEKGLDLVEIIRKQTAEMRQRCRIAIAVAAAAGFIMGVILTVLYPYLEALIADIRMPVWNINRDILHAVGWVLMGAVCSLTAYNAYEITLFGLSSHKVK